MSTASSLGCSWTHSTKWLPQAFLLLLLLPASLAGSSSSHLTAIPRMTQPHTQNLHSLSQLCGSLPRLALCSPCPALTRYHCCGNLGSVGSMKTSRLVLRFATCCSSHCTWGQRGHGAPLLPPWQLSPVPAAPQAPCPPASNLPRRAVPGELTASCQHAGRATAAPRPSLLASPVQLCQGGSAGCPAADSAPVEQEGQSVELCRAAGCQEPASCCDMLHAPLRCQRARPLGWSQGPEVTAALPHHHAGIWHCWHCPAHLALRTRTESPAGSRGCPVPCDHSSPQGGDASSVDPLPLPATCWGPTWLYHRSQSQGLVQGSSAHYWLTWQYDVPRIKDRPLQMAGRTPALHIPVVPWPNGCARAGGVRGNASPHHCAESGNSHQRSATEKGAGWTGEPGLSDSPSHHLQARALGAAPRRLGPRLQSSCWGSCPGTWGSISCERLRELAAGDKAAGETLGPQQHSLCPPHPPTDPHVAVCPKFSNKAAALAGRPKGSSGREGQAFRTQPGRGTNLRRQNHCSSPRPNQHPLLLVRGNSGGLEAPLPRWPQPGQGDSEPASAPPDRPLT